MSNRVVRGGRQRGEPKEQVFTMCPVCHERVSRRKSRLVDRNGESVRVCKHHMK